MRDYTMWEEFKASCREAWAPIYYGVKDPWTWVQVILLAGIILLMLIVFIH